MISIQNPQCWT